MRTIFYSQSCEFEPCSRWGVLDIILCDKVCQWLATGRWFFPGTPKTGHHDIPEIMLKVALSIINQPTKIRRREKKLFLNEFDYKHLKDIKTSSGPF